MAPVRGPVVVLALVHPVVSRVLQYGGTRQVNEAALVQGWTKALELLKSLAG